MSAIWWVNLGVSIPVARSGGRPAQVDPEQTIAEQQCGHQLGSSWTAGTGGLPLEKHPWETYLCRKVLLLRSPAAALP